MFGMVIRFAPVSMDGQDLTSQCEALLSLGSRVNAPPSASGSLVATGRWIGPTGRRVDMLRELKTLIWSDVTPRSQDALLRNRTTVTKLATQVLKGRQ